jgi:hypothetical protein
MITTETLSNSLDLFLIMFYLEHHILEGFIYIQYDALKEITLENIICVATVIKSGTEW